jgi:hypothetical protein
VEVRWSFLKGIINKMNLNTAIIWARKTYGVNVNKNSNSNFTVAFKTSNGARSYIKVTHDPEKMNGKLANGFSDPGHRGMGVGTALRALATWILYIAGYHSIKHQGVNKESLVGPNQYPVSTKLVRKHIGFKRYRRNEPNEPSNNYSHKGSPSGEFGYNSKWTPNRRAVLTLKKTVRKSVPKLRKFRNTYEKVSK